MNSIILSTSTRYLLPLLLLLSVYLLLRGHNLPGGGLVGGLVAAAAYALYAIAEGIVAARKVLRIHPRTLIVAGLVTALTSGVIASFKGLPFMTGLWTEGKLVFFEKLGTPLLLDMGVYMVVVGVVLMIIFTLMEE